MVLVLKLLFQFKFKFKKLIIFFLFFINILNASLVSIEKDFSKENNLSPQKQLFSSEKNLSFKEIKDYFKNNNSSNKIKLLRGKTSYLWSYYELKNNSLKDINLIIKHQFIVTDYVDFYIEILDKIYHFKAGEFIKSSKKSIYDRFHLAQISLKKNQKAKIWINYKTQGSLNNLIDIYSKNEYKKFISNENLFFGFYSGVIIAMIIYNLFLFFIFFEKVYIFYILHLFTAFIYQVIFTGYVAFYELASPEYINTLSRLASNLSIFSSILFSIYFLNLKFILPKLNFILKFIATILIVIFILTLIFNEKMYVLSDIGTTILNLITMVLIIVSAVFAIKKGSIEARFFLLSWIVLAIASPLFTLSLGGLINTSLSPDKILQIAFIFESLMFSFALADRVNKLKRDKQRSDAIIFKKSKLADMGIMLSSISHQWRQPLTQISSILMRLQFEKKYGKFSDKNFDNSINDVSNILKYMSLTIDDFRKYVKTDKIKETFNLKETIEAVLKISESAIKSLNIKVNIDNISSKNIFGNKNELMQVFLNIITNARYIFEEREILNPTINIKIFESKKFINIIFCDNGGGVKKEILAKIFEDFYTTREREGGSGLGLYIAKDIITKNFNGDIKAYNKKDGACFEITILIQKK